ncbi:peroxisome biogenesis protein 12 [Cocos nucifera]|uniref:Peroxisome biogenesis protein 12 n=1 Tax=Cocos nucifera TaxID=13894 RepID=A0A8K0N7Z5_COCNU|nr:peroxisome biogenesis protein 12 [Cocos nucifera]
MLFQVGGQGTRPTFFEMAAAQQLPASLRAALTYSLGVFALRRPFLHKVLDYNDEFFALLMMVLESHSLRTTDASFSESLYGLRRRAVKITYKKYSSNTESNDKIHHSGLEKHQKVASVAFLVILPYIKSKLHYIYNREREARLQASLWGHDDARFDDTDFLLDQGESSHSQVEAFSVEGSHMMHLKKRIMAVIACCYPWIHATNEGFYSPGLHALGIHVCRATGQELMDSSSRISRIRSRELERLRGLPWLKAVKRVLLSCIYTTLDYAQTGLIAAVFFFKMMEWWYQSAEERMLAPTVYLPPPPPPPPKVAKDGIPLPPGRTLCPLCSQNWVNPSVIAVSGFVFCYACIFKYVSQYKRCPVTLMPATVEHIRRLFHDL